MKHYKRYLALICALLLAVCVFTGCSASTNAAYDTATGYFSNYKTEDAPAAAEASRPAETPMADESWAEPEETVSTQSYSGEDGLTPTADSALSAEKIIYSADLYLQTTEFDKTMQTLEQNVAACGGFVEGSNVYGDIRYNDDGTTQVVNRTAYYTVRVPAAQFEGFLKQADGLGNVLSSSRNAENVTSSYTDYEARLSSLNTQEERLLDMLKKTTDVESLVALEQRLSDVRYEIESIERNLRNLDRKITYSTVSLTLEEVEVYTPTAPVQRTFGEKLASAFSDGWNGFVRGFQRLCIGLVSALPALVLLAILVVIVLLIVRKLRKKHAAKREKQAQAAKPDAPEGT